MSDTRFQACLPFILKWEGGFVNDPKDPGGATNRGVTQAVYDGYRTSKGEAHRSVKSITDAEVSDIYQKNYWNAAKCPSLPPPLDLIMFDTAVNMGVGAAVKLLQTALKVSADGVWGPGTQKALDAQKANPKALEAAYFTAKEARYRHLVEVNPNLSKFLKGWLNRLTALKAEAAKVA